jgi:hypothetical protein
VDQDSVVAHDVEWRGSQLMDALDQRQFEVRLALWAKPADEHRWYLYLASPFVAERGAADAYQIVNQELRKSPELQISPMQIVVLRPDDSPAREAAEMLKPEIRNSPFAVPYPKPYPGMTVLHDCTLGGYEFDEVLIYPPRQPLASS